MEDDALLAFNAFMFIGGAYFVRHVCVFYVCV